MPNVGPMELGIVLIIALVIFGPKRLPELGKSLGSGMRGFKDSLAGKDDEDGKDDLSDTEAEQPKLAALTAQPQADAQEPVNAAPLTGAPDSP